MAATGFHWVIPPSRELIPNLQEYGRRAEAAIHAVASRWGQQVQDATRTNARWEDRTGNARSGLFYAVEGFGHGEVRGDVGEAVRSLMSETSIETAPDGVLIIAVSHTMFYGKFLELSNGGRFAIIMTEIERNLPGLERQVREIFR
jgi:hypothetical protein